MENFPPSRSSGVWLSGKTLLSNKSAALQLKDVQFLVLLHLGTRFQPLIQHHPTLKPLQKYSVWSLVHYN